MYHLGIFKGKKKANQSHCTNLNEVGGSVNITQYIDQQLIEKCKKSRAAIEINAIYKINLYPNI